MRGLSEHLGLLVLQQRAAATSLDSDLLCLLREVTALRSLTADYGTTSPSLTSPAEDSEGSRSDGRGRLPQQNRALPPQGPLRLALETERQGLLRGLEAVREVQLLLKAVVGSDPPAPPPAPASTEARLRRARGGEGWGEAPTDPVTAAEVKSAIDGLEALLCKMLGRVEEYPAVAVGVLGVEGEDGSFVAPPLLAAGAARVIVETREALRACAADARGISERFAGVLPRAVLVRVAQHLDDVDGGVGAVLDRSNLMRSWLAADGNNADGMEVDVDGGGGGGVSSDARRRAAAAEHASKVGEWLTDAVKAMLLSVQALCPRDTAVKAGDAAGTEPGTEPGSGDEPREEEEVDDGWSTDTTLFEAHASAFEQARGLKLWRCASAMRSARLALKALSEDEAVGCSGGGGGVAGEAAVALVALCAEVLVLAEQVLSAGKAVLVGMLALNKVRARALRCACWREFCAMVVL